MMSLFLRLHLEQVQQSHLHHRLIHYLTVKFVECYISAFNASIVQVAALPDSQ